MSENVGPGEPAAPGVLARHVAERRTQLGMSEDALAFQAGMSPRYLQHVLDAGPDFDPGGFVRIATALGVTYQELLEGRQDMPPGQAEPAAHPVLMRLSEAECWEELGSHGVGRVALPVQPGPAVYPVNYAVDARTIVYRTAPGDPAAPETGAAVSFQADRVDDRVSQGWSVLITGDAERVGDSAALRALAELHEAEPWAGGGRDLWIRITPETVTGRRITSL